MAVTASRFTGGAAADRGGASFSGPPAPYPISLRLCQRMAPMGPDSPIAGRVGEKHFFSRIAAILFGGPRGFHPRTPTYFSLVGKVGKSTHREGTLSTGSLPYVPLPRDDSKGARPLWNPPSIDGTYPKFLWILPRIRLKNHVSKGTNRNIHLFNRAGGRSLVDHQTTD